MTRSGDTLVYMANQIATFFQSQKHETAELGVADHIAAFWDPTMRRAIYAQMDAGGDGLSPLARAGLERLRARPAKVVRRELAQDGGVVMAHGCGSDAG